MKIREIMSRDPTCCVLSDTAQTVAKILCDRNIGSMPVVADQQSRKLVGMITDRDLCCSVIAEGMDPKTTPVEKLISLAPVTCREGENVEACERLMQEHQVRRISIVDAEDRIIGIVSQADLALREQARAGIEDGRGNLESFAAHYRENEIQPRRPLLAAVIYIPTGAQMGAPGSTAFLFQLLRRAIMRIGFRASRILRNGRNRRNSRPLPCHDQ